jgi:uncharacterized membrane protein (UPF0136 family)
LSGVPWPPSARGILNAVLTGLSSDNQTTGIDQTTIILAAIVTIALVAVAAILIVKHRKQAPNEVFEPAEHNKTTRRERKNQ